jgi:hypothetical protein
MLPPSWRRCDECGTKHDVERIAPGRWLCFSCASEEKTRHAVNEASAKLGAVRVVLVVAAFGVACSSTPESAPVAEQRYGAVGYDFEPGSECVLLAEHHYAPAGLCFRITADEWSTVVTCEGTHADDYVGKTWPGPSYPTSSFVIPGGGCFQFYNCTPEGVLAPEVTPC